MRLKPILIPALVLAVLLAAVSVSPALAALKSPTKFCKKAGGVTTKCVSLAKDARAEARKGKKSDGNKKRKPGNLAGKYCRANGANVGSKAYKKCVKKAKKAAKAAGSSGGGGGGGGGGTAKQCSDGRDNDADGKVDFPADPDCTSATDNTETEQYVPGDDYYVPDDYYAP